MLKKSSVHYNSFINDLYHADDIVVTRVAMTSTAVVWMKLKIWNDMKLEIWNDMDAPKITGYIDILKWFPRLFRVSSCKSRWNNITCPYFVTTSLIGWAQT